MRLTTASVAAVVLIAAGIVTFWPGNNAGPGRAQVVAQNPAGPGPATDNEAAPLAAQRRALDEKLNQPVDVAFVETPLGEAIQFLRDKTDIQFIIKTKKLEEAGASVDVPVNLILEGVKLRTLLELLLEPIELTYMTKDDLILITTPEDAESPDRMIIRVYDCRELLASPPVSVRPKATGGPGLGGRGGSIAVQDQPPAKINPAAGDGAASAPAGGTPDSSAAGSAHGEGIGIANQGAAPQENYDADYLIDVIMTIVDQETWVDVGGPSAIAEYKGLLTVATTQDTHQKVERLLNMFHQAAGLKEQRVKVVE